MKLFELFCGTKSVSNYCEQNGWETVTLDFNPKFQADYCMDILKVDDKWLEDYKTKHGTPDVIWASPDCRHYSKIRYNWKAMGYPEPDLEYADKLVRKALYIIEYLKPLHWFLENPATGLLKTRGILDGIPKKICCYCKYDEDGTFLTKKETAVWGSVSKWNPRMCTKVAGYCQAKATHGKHMEGIGHTKPGCPEVPRKQRLRIPPLLVQHLFENINKNAA
jgi:hypothetical protein